MARKRLVLIFQEIFNVISKFYFSKISISIKAINLVPNKSEKKDVGKYGIDLSFAGILFKENDYIYSDPDGIVVSSSELIK